MTSAVLLVGAGLLVAACGDDDDDDASPSETTETETTETEAETETTEGEADGAAETVAVTAVDYEFEDLPETVPAGTAFSLTNESETELHELVALRIPDDEDRSVEELVTLPEEELETIFTGDPAMVLIAPPGEDGMAVVGDGTLSEPGRYAMVCFIPTGADPEEFLAGIEEAEDGPPDVEGGPPHFVHGMHGEVTVE